MLLERLHRAAVAKAGAVAFAIALVPHWALGAVPDRAALGGEIATADVALTAAAAASELRPELPGGLVLPELRAPRVRSMSVAQLAPRSAYPPPEPLVTDGAVLASWYGPGFYGNRTACGHTYTPEVLGVAHRTLRCGTRIALTSPRGITLTVAVIDRGPYVAGRSLDLSNATRTALECSDLCRVHMRVME